MTTQDPQNPEDPRPSEASAAAWAPRPEPTPPSTSSESSASETPDSSASEPLASEPAAPEPETGWAPSTGGGEPPPGATAPGTPVAVHTPPQAGGGRRSGIPLWLMLLSVIVAATLAGVAVYFFTGDDGDGGGDLTEAATIVDGLMRLGREDQSNISSYAGEVPPDFAPEFPIYEGAEVVVAIAIGSEQGTGYLIVLSTPDSAEDVFTYYSDALDQEPWQVEIGRSSDEFTGLRFLRPDNIDVSGDVSLHRSQLAERTVIYLSYNDISQAIVPGGSDDPFALGQTRQLPAGFPDDIPIYEGAEESIVLDTYFERGQGGRAFIVTFLTRDSQNDVIDFYREEFEERGWVVSDAGVAEASFALAIEFDDGPDDSVSGSISADSFEDDPSYTQVDLLVTTSGNRGN